MERSRASDHEANVRRIWATRGLPLTEGRVEGPGVYAPVLVVPRADPAQLVDAWASALEAAGFVPVQLRKLREDEAGVVPRIAAMFGGRAARRAEETIIYYAMHGGLPEAGVAVPCRGSLCLLTRELLAHWSSRGLEGIGEVLGVSDNLLVIGVKSDALAALEVTRAALVATGARESRSEAENATADRQQLAARMATKGLSARDIEEWFAAYGSAVERRRLTLEDRDGAALTIEAAPSGDRLRVERAPPDEASSS